MIHKVKPQTIPTITDDRLSEMQRLASEVWRGQKMPKIQCSEDVLRLVPEIRRLRSIVANQNLTEEQISMKKMMDGIFPDGEFPFPPTGVMETYEKMKEQQSASSEEKKTDSRFPMTRRFLKNTWKMLKNPISPLGF